MESGYALLDHVQGGLVKDYVVSRCNPLAPISLGRQDRKSRRCIDARPGADTRELRRRGAIDHEHPVHACRPT